MALAFPIARTKLLRPTLLPELVHRPRLVQLLSDGFKHPVTLVAAPAGYGKSTLLAQWLMDAPCASCWLSLDEGDNQLGLFANHVVAAIQTLYPGSLQATLNLIHFADAVTPLELANTLGNEVAEFPEEFILVLDDYHCIQDQAIHELVSVLIRHMPTTLHLVIATRTSAPLPLGKLRAGGHLSELRAQELCFTPDETRAFLANLLRETISEEMARRLQERIGGWAAGLRFASQLVRQDTSATDVIERLVTQNDRHLMDYLLGEVKSSKAPLVQDFMLRTSLVERFTPGLANALLEPDGAGNAYAIIDDLVRDNLLDVERDADEKWFSYLDLFREFLRARAMVRLNSQEIATIHRRASGWFRSHRYITQAIQHAIAAGDVKCAAQMVGENIHAALDDPPAPPRIARWLGLFPPSALDEYVELVLARAWQLSISLRLAGIPPLLARAEELLTAEAALDTAARRRMMGDIAYHRLFLAYFTDEAPHILERVSEVADILPLHSGFARGNIVFIEACALQLAGKLDDALQRLTDALKNDPAGSAEFASRVLVALATIYSACADLHGVAKTSADILRLGKRSIGTAAAHFGLGEAHYEWNNLEVAAQHFATAVELSPAGNLKLGQESCAWLALTQQARGSSQAASAAMQNMLTFTDATDSGALQYDAEAYRARLALLQGDLNAALRWAKGVSFNPRPHMLFEVEAYLSRLRILLAVHKPEYVRTMLEETNALLAYAESTHDVRRSIQLYALQAMAHDALGRRFEALDSLERSLQLGEPGGFLRTYLDLGPGIARLLQLLLPRSQVPAMIHRILDAGAANGRGQILPSARENHPARLIEPLTFRELQVMAGIAEQKTNKEIARDLVISPQTVKAHVDHIFQKLSVGNRQEAVRVAQAYGIIQVPAHSNGVH